MPALAHGGGTPQLTAAPAGPYQIFAWTNPNPVRVGVLHVTVALVDPATNQPVMNAAVQVQAKPIDATAAPVTSQATHDKATIKTYYETDMQIPAAGQWQVTVAFQNAANSGSASFDLAVKPQSNTRWLLIGGLAVAAIVIAWLFGSKKQSDPVENHSQLA